MVHGRPGRNAAILAAVMAASCRHIFLSEPEAVATGFFARPTFARSLF